MNLVCQHECNEKAQKRNSVNASQGTMEQPSRTIVHAKLEMTSPDSPEEVEADAAANDIVQGGKIARSIFAGSAGGGMAVSSQMEGRLNSMQGGGQAMPDGLRNMMERGFNRDFSQVRLHTDSEAASLSSSIHAKAFTHGNDIYFNQGQYSPNTSEGQKLMAHELTHVVQGGGKVGRELVFPGQPRMHDYHDDHRTKNIGFRDGDNSHVSENIVREDVQDALVAVIDSINYLEKLKTNYNNANKERFEEIFNLKNDIDRIQTVYEKIRNVIELKKLYISFSRLEGNTYAFVWPNDKRYSIALTEFYFNSDKYDRINTIIHELAHEVGIDDVNVPGENVVAYGLENVKKLSGHNISMNNADNYSFFSELILRDKINQERFNQEMLKRMLHNNNWNLNLNYQNGLDINSNPFLDFNSAALDEDSSLIKNPVVPYSPFIKIPEFNWLIYPGFNPLSLYFRMRFSI